LGYNLHFWGTNYIAKKAQQAQKPSKRRKSGFLPWRVLMKTTQKANNAQFIVFLFLRGSG
jgi:hypothetical protein